MNSIYRFGRFELDPATRQLRAGGEVVPLGARAFDVLVALLERRERLVTKEELLQIAWSGLVVEEGNLQVQISALRKVLGPDAIATIPGRGYRFSAQIEGEPPAERALPSPGGIPKQTAYIAILAAVLALLAVAGSWYGVGPKVPSPATPASPSPAALSPDDKSIAVLPFANLSDDRDLAFFADGMHDDLLTQLSYLGALKVVASSSVARYRDSTKNSGQIASELGVASLLKGSVRRSASRVRVSAQLIDARNDRLLWAQTYDRDLKDTFAIQAEIATAIAEALKVSLDPGERTRLARSPTANPEAYELFLRHANLRRNIGADFSLDERQSERISLLARAVDLDPGFALAWARLGADHARAHFFQLDAAVDHLARATRAIDRALALAPEDIGVKNELGTYYYYGLLDYPRAARFLEDVLRVAPNHVEVLIQLSLVKRRLGRWPQANALLERALSVDPRNAHAITHLVSNLWYLRRMDEAIAAHGRLFDASALEEQVRRKNLERVKSGTFAAYDRWRATLTESDAAKSFRVWMLDISSAAARGALDQALRILDSTAEKSAWDLAMVSELRLLTLHAMGERERARALAQALLQQNSRVLEQRGHHDHALRRVAVAHAVLGERRLAMVAFERRLRVAERTMGAPDVDDLYREKTVLHALLGERERALQLVESVLKRTWFYRLPDSYLGTVSLREDPRFLALLNDPANRAPLPVVDWDLQKMLAELATPEAR